MVCLNLQGNHETIIVGIIRWLWMSKDGMMTLLWILTSIYVGYSLYIEKFLRLDAVSWRKWAQVSRYLDNFDRVSILIADIWDRHRSPTELFHQQTLSNELNFYLHHHRYLVKRSSSFFLGDKRKFNSQSILHPVNFQPRTQPLWKAVVAWGKFRQSVHGRLSLSNYYCDVCHQAALHQDRNKCIQKATTVAINWHCPGLPKCDQALLSI